MIALAFDVDVQIGKRQQIKPQAPACARPGFLRRFLGRVSVEGSAASS